MMANHCDGDVNGDGYTVTIAMDDEVRLPTMEKDGNIPKMSL
jgi:hypothetical protein